MEGTPPTILYIVTRLWHVLNFVSPRLKTGWMYRISRVHPCVRPSVQKGFPPRKKRNQPEIRSHDHWTIRGGGYSPIINFKCFILKEEQKLFFNTKISIHTQIFTLFDFKDLNKDWSDDLNILFFEKSNTNIYKFD